MLVVIGLYRSRPRSAHDEVTAGRRAPKVGTSTVHRQTDLSRSVGAPQTRDDGLAVGAGGQWLAISRESGDAPKAGELRFRYGDVISSGVMLEVVLQCRHGLDSQKNTRSAVRRLLCYSMESSTSRGFQTRRPTRRLCAEVLGADVVTARHHGQDRKENAPLGSPGQGWVAVTVEQP